MTRLSRLATGPFLFYAVILLFALSVITLITPALSVAQEPELIAPEEQL